MSDATATFQNGVLILQGDWKRTAPHPDADQFLKDNPIEGPWKIDASQLGKWDSILLSFLSKVLAYGEKQGNSADLTQLPEGLRRILDLGVYGRKNATAQRRQQDQELSIVHKSGLFGLELKKTIHEIIYFTGDVTLSLFRLITFRSKMRWGDFFAQVINCGPRALGIVSLISFLMGLILAFVGSIPLKWFHAEPYVASLVGIGMLRLMAPVMVGVVMAGRTSASYAAELGTMQVNEELDALHTLGVPQTDFLVLPRFLAMTLMLPVLAVFADIVSIIGGMIVAVFDMDLTAHAYLNTLVTTTRLNDLFVGLITCFVLGTLDACCGCYQGIHCGRSAAAVGKITTAAVVYSIVCIVIATSLITVITVILKI